MSKIGRNDPCPCGSGKKYKNCHLGKPDDPAVGPGGPAAPRAESGSRLPAPLPDFWSTPPDLDAGAWETDWDDEDLPEDRSDRSSEDEAWDIIDRAFDELPGREWPAEIDAALKLYPRCSGAFYLRAKLERAIDKQIALYERAIATADDEIGPELFPLIAGSNWDIPHVEYGMLARNDRAIALAAEGRLDESVEANEELLRLDPSDRLRVAGRHVLLLLALERIDEAIEFLYQRGATSLSDETLAFASALVRFARDGDTFFARRALADAMVSYPDTYEMLASTLGDMPDDLEPGPAPDEAEVADELLDELGFEPSASELEDAMTDLYGILTMITAWGTTEGAEEWLHAVRAKGPGARSSIETDPSGPELAVGLLPSPLPRCPACQGRLRTSPLTLVVQLEPDELLPVAGKLRECAGCGRLVIGLDTVIERAVEHAPDEPGRDCVPVGVLPNSLATPDSLDQDAIRANMQRLSGLFAEGESETEWPTRESQEAALLEFFGGAGEGLFGPITPPNPFRT